MEWGGDACSRGHALGHSSFRADSQAPDSPTGPVTSYEQLHGNWIKSTDCESAGLEDDQDEVNCICQKIM